MDNQLTTNQQPQEGYAALVKLVGQDDVRARFESALGKNTGAFLASLVNTVGTTPALRECDASSILRAAMTAAVLNLPVDKNIGHAWIIPYREHGKPVAQFQMGYKGFIQLCLRTGQYTHLNAANIYEGMGVEENVLTGNLKIVGTKLSEKVIGYAAYLRLKNGFEKAVYWTYEKVQDHARRYSKSYGRDTSPWTTHPDEMGKKTVIMYLVKHWGIMSVTVQEAIEAEEKPAAKAQDLSDYIEGEMHEPDEPKLITEDVPATLAFDPIKLLVDNKLVKSEYGARELLKRIPDSFKASPEELLGFMHIYRAWKESGVSTEQALQYATEGVPFED